MRLIVLGSGAGGGVPQWNAGNAISRLAFRGDPTVPRRSQASIAVTADGVHWAIVNASPDIRSQIIATPALHPQGKDLRATPISSVVLTGADIDQITGLLILRERQPFTLFATERVLDVLDDNSVFNVLAEGVVARDILPLDGEVEIAPGLIVEAITLPGKPPLYLEDVMDLAPEYAVGFVVALRITDETNGSVCLFAPACAHMTPELRDAMEDIDVLLFDGTFYNDDEMIITGEGKKSAQRMGHMPVSGRDGALMAFAAMSEPRKIFIHINNTNPMAARDSDEAATVLAAGWDIAEDGMEIEL